MELSIVRDSYNVFIKQFLSLITKIFVYLLKNYVCTQCSFYTVIPRGERSYFIKINFARDHFHV